MEVRAPLTLGLLRRIARAHPSATPFDRIVTFSAEFEGEIRALPNFTPAEVYKADLTNAPEEIGRVELFRFVRAPGDTMSGQWTMA